MEDLGVALLLDGVELLEGEEGAEARVVLFELVEHQWEC